MSKWLKKTFNPEPIDLMDDKSSHKRSKTQFGMLGPVASGKSTVAAGLVLESMILSSINSEFYCRVLTKNSPILKDANNLRIGRFPKKTDSLADPPQAGFVIGEKGWKNKQVFVPIYDVAGEITDYLSARAEGLTPREIIEQRVSSINTTVVKNVRDCAGLIVALSAEDALMFRKDYTAKDTDAYTHNVLSEVFEYRRRQHKKDPHVIFIITKWDKVQTQAKDLKMDAYYSDEEMARFLDNGFPATSMLLKPLIDKGNVKFFRSWFKLAKDEEDNIIYWNHPETGEPTTSPRIKIIDYGDDYIRFRPDFAETDYRNIIKHIGSFAK